MGTLTLTDMDGTTRTVGEGEPVTLEHGAAGTLIHLHARQTIRRADGGVILKGDGCELPLTGYRFADPPDGPADGRLQLTANGTGMWVERDARHIRLRADGKWVTGHGIPPLPEHDVTVSGRPAVWLGVARTFGTTDIRWLARKQCEESCELRDAVRQWGTGRRATPARGCSTSWPTCCRRSPTCAPPCTWTTWTSWPHWTAAGRGT